ncbi:non-homologous end-joining DNA ligase [Tardiphaga sp. 709]|uniref:non-homologous end-joining DNA ligase n=1 Tax=Tardiphaga sp. 709 TaxID=3076039 RepID=UPI0028EA5C7E|nr:non-homologous end-joining DNA ligase [Tardiphaga sp. 709]WNV10075.1 non-homologous end-joining DNA ligase [Tardiphaga sp. 709]
MPYPKPKAPEGGVKAAFPGFVAPALASSIGKVPSGDRWIHEVKFDGYRVQLHIVNEGIHIYTRNGHDWTDRFKKIAADAWHLKTKSAIIDGEVVVPAENGTTDFSALQNALRAGKPSDQLVMYGFDLVYLNGYDMRKVPLVTRKAELSALLKNSHILLSQSFDVDGAHMLKTACEMGLEGVVSKRRDSRYSSGRTDAWVKMTCRNRETLQIVGFALKENRFDGLYVGRREGNNLIYAGKVDHGFTSAAVTDVRKRLAPLVQKAQAYSQKIKKPNAVWVKPSLLAEVEYRAKSADGKLRHPVFKGVREDL